MCCTAYPFIYLLYAPLLRHVTSCCIKRFQAASRIDMPFCGGEKMTPAWAQRQAELLRDCIVSPDVFQHMVDRLSDFPLPYQHVAGVSQVLITCAIARSFGGSSPLASTPVTHAPYLKPSCIGSALLTSDVVSTLAVSRAKSRRSCLAAALSAAPVPGSARPLGLPIAVP